jgi:rhodanese-related sulfurtransferase
MNKFCASPRTLRVLAHGPTKSSVLTTKGVQVDLRVVEPAVWVAALMYFTGSKPHNIPLRALAARAGLKLSEYGLFDADAGELLAAATEEGVYARLGLPWIPPPLREDRGEIEAALDGRLPHLVQEADIRGDLHVHTEPDRRGRAAGADGRGSASAGLRLLRHHRPRAAAERDDRRIRAFRDQVVAHMGSPLIDVRSPGEYTGELLHMPDYPQEGALRGGHIPGAKNVPWSRAAADDATFRTHDELEAIYADEAGLHPDDDIVVYCRIGERSSHT